MVYNHFCSSLPRNRCFGFRSSVAALAAWLSASFTFRFFDYHVSRSSAGDGNGGSAFSRSLCLSLRFPPLVGVFLRRLCACYILFVRCCCCSPSHFLTTILGGERCWRFSSSVCCYFRYAFIAIVFTAATSVCYRFLPSAAPSPHQRRQRQDDVEVCVSRTLRITHRHPHPFTNRSVVCLSYAFVVCDRFAVAFHDSNGYLLLLLLMIPFSLRSPSAIVAFIIIHDMF